MMHCIQFQIEVKEKSTDATWQCLLWNASFSPPEIKKLLLLTGSNDGTPISQLSKAQLQSKNSDLFYLMDE
jgi:hypothetical protein